MLTYLDTLVRNKCTEQSNCPWFIPNTSILQIPLPRFSPYLRLESISQHDDLAPAIPPGRDDYTIAVKGIWLVQKGEGIFNGSCGVCC